MDRNIFRLVHIGAMLLLFSRCAQIVTLTGGPRDVSPPKMIKSIPDTFQTNFSANKIKLEFDEYVEVENVRKNLLITPVLRYDPIVTANNKTVIIRNIDDSLWQNTTYVIEFNEAIQDITEHNKAKGFRYVFSTGPAVDSLELAGVIRDAFTLEPIADAFAFVYESHDDSIPYKKPPRYIGRSNENGIFIIRNMKQGSYKLFFCTDGNRNYLYDLPSEKIDFLDDAVLVSGDTINRHLGYLYNEDSQKQYLKGYGSVKPGSFYLAYNKKADSLYFEQTAMKEDWLDNFNKEYNGDRDSIVFWLKDTVQHFDTLKFTVRADTMPADTLKIAMKLQTKPVKVTPRPLITGGLMDLGDSLVVEFDFPLIHLDRKRVQLLRDSIVLEPEIIVDQTKRRLTLVTNWQEEGNYKLIMDTAAFIDILGMANDSASIGFAIRKATFYGTLDLKIDVAENANGILQILDMSGKVKEEIYMAGRNRQYFQYLHPGEYRLKYICDDNENRAWDPGNYLKKKHAEKIYIYQSNIVIRSNWDQVIEWKLN